MPTSASKFYIVVLPPESITNQEPGWNTQLWVFGSKNDFDYWVRGCDADDKARIIIHVVESISFGSAGNVWVMNADGQL